MVRGFCLAAASMGLPGTSPAAHLPQPANPAPPARHAEHRRKKAAGNNAAPMPRAVDPERSRTKERMRAELGALGLDAGGCVGVGACVCLCARW